jgi:hypothetical protein
MNVRTRVKMIQKQTRDCLERYFFTILVSPSTANLKCPNETLKKEEPKVIAKNLKVLLNRSIRITSREVSQVIIVRNVNTNQESFSSKAKFV